jgi:uncharacterized protein with PIN domain
VVLVKRNKVYFRFYEELNDFLPPDKRKIDFVYTFRGNPGIKDPIEVLGVPHTEVDLIIVNGESVAFDYKLRDGDRVSVYPVFESFDISPLVRLRERPLRDIRFIVDVNLGKLARNLRLLGFDCLYRNDYTDAEVVKINQEQQRIILTRDKRLLFHRCITHGHLVPDDDPVQQTQKVLKRFQLENEIRPFHRCLDCNGHIQPVDKAEVRDVLYPKTSLFYDKFYQCADCRKVYWQGPHFNQMIEKIRQIQPAN